MSSFNDNKVTSFDFLNSSMPDRPNTLFSTNEFKGKLDSQALQLQAGLNGIIDALMSAIAGSSASEQIGSATILGVAGNTVYQQLADLKAQIQAIVGASIPTGSITTAMIQNGSVTFPKLSSDVVDAIEKNPQVIALERVQANLVALAEINGLSIGQSGYGYDLFRGAANNLYSAAKMDTTRGRIANAISGGQTSVVVTDVQGTFAIGQEVTLQDVVTDSARQRLIISNVVGSTITFTAPTNAYAANAQLYRSLASIDLANQKLEFGVGLYPNAVTAAPSTVASGVSDPTVFGGSAGNNGRKMVRTGRGWLVVVAALTTSNRVFYISKDGGTTWAQLCNCSLPTPNNGSLAVFGDTVYWAAVANSQLLLFEIDTVNQANLDILPNGNALDIGYPAFPNADIIAGSDGVLHISCSDTVQNVLYTKVKSKNVLSVDVLGFGQGQYQTYINFDKNGKIFILAANSSSSYDVRCAYQVAPDVFQYVLVGAIGNGSQGFSAVIKRSGSNIGRIMLVHNAASAPVKYSDDDGKTWANMTNALTNLASTNHCITEDTNTGNVNVIYHDTNTTFLVSTIANGSTTVGAPVTYDGTSILSQSSIATLENAPYTVPVTVYLRSSSIVFRGTWTAQLSKDFTQVDVRYNITPPEGTMDELRSWIQYEDFAGFTVTSSLSVVGPSANESFVAMTPDNTDFGSVIESYFNGSVVTPNSKATQKITMTRAATSENRTVNKYLAAIIAP